MAVTFVYCWKVNVYAQYSSIELGIDVVCMTQISFSSLNCICFRYWLKFVQVFN